MEPQDNPQLVDPVLDLPAAAFASVDEDRRASLMIRAANVPFHGIRVSAPHRVDLDAADDLPLLYARKTNGVRDWQVSFRPNSTLLGVDLVSGIVRTRWALGNGGVPDPRRIDRSRSGLEPDELAREGTNTEVLRLNALEVLGLPRDPPGRYALTVIHHDWLSNTVVVEVSRGSSEASRLPPAPLEPETARAFADRFRRGPAGSQPWEDAPTLEREGLEASLVPTAEGGRVLRAVIRRPALSCECVRAQPGARAVAHPDDPGTPAGFLQVSLVLVRLDELRRPQLNLMIPVVVVGGPVSPGDSVEAHLQLDLSAWPGPGAIRDDARIYLISGGLLAGPFPGS